MPKISPESIDLIRIRQIWGNSDGSIDWGLGQIPELCYASSTSLRPSDDLQCCKDVENADKDMYQSSLRSMSALGMLLRTTLQHLNPGETVPTPPLSSPAVE